MGSEDVNAITTVGILVLLFSDCTVTGGGERGGQVPLLARLEILCNSRFEHTKVRTLPYLITAK